VKEFVQHFELESKQQSMELCHSAFEKRKEFKNVLTGGKIMATRFPGEKKVTPFRVLPRETGENCESCAETLNVPLRQIYPPRKMLEMLFLHDIRPNTRARVTRAATQLRWRVLPHAFYSPHLATSDFHLLDTLKFRLQKQNLPDDAHCRAPLQ
jgi:hypothetical protein